MDQRRTAGGALGALVALEEAGRADAWGRTAGLYRIIDRYGRTGLVRLGGAITGQGVDGLLAAWRTRLLRTPAVAAALRDHPGTDGLALAFEREQCRWVYGRSVRGDEYVVSRCDGAEPRGRAGTGVLAADDPVPAALAALLDLIHRGGEPPPDPAPWHAGPVPLIRVAGRRRGLPEPADAGPRGGGRCGR